MRFGSTILFIISIIIYGTAYGSVERHHQFSDNECRICHADIHDNPASLKPMSSAVCERCHANIRHELSHPVDILAKTPAPVDMPLEGGKLSCITCHFVHPFSINPKNSNYFMLRKPKSDGKLCSGCHKIEAKGHTFFETIHLESYQETNRPGTLDRYTLQCIECHDDKLDRGLNGFGAGKWRYYSRSKLNHSIGVSYSRAFARQPQDFNPPDTLPPEIRLFNGKLGCGTCHNIYSKERFMLATSNWRSSLCLTCHIK